MRNLTAALLASGMAITVIPAATAQDAGMQVDLDGATVVEIQNANSAMAIDVNQDMSGAMPANVDELRQALETNAALTAFFDQSNFDPQDAYGVDAQDDGSLMVFGDFEGEVDGEVVASGASDGAGGGGADSGAGAGAGADVDAGGDDSGVNVDADADAGDTDVDVDAGAGDGGVNADADASAGDTNVDADANADDDGINVEADADVGGVDADADISVN